jgi:hypothetical protein
MQGGFTHQFVMEFANAEDRNYYSSKDAFHQSVIELLTPRVEKVQIVDIIDGQF